ncbi:MAG: tetratricopeptide repeat protein [Armatimonadetes bacterium]|nr:tetratricopeptide repeat protein [Armatimonadota bacterium]
MKIFRALILVVALALTLSRGAHAGTNYAGAEFSTALQQYYQQQWPQAIESFHKIMEQDPRDTLSLHYLIHCYIKRNDMRSVLYNLEQKAVQSNNKDAVALAQLGIGYISRSMREPQMLDQAQKAFEQALTIDNNLSIANCGLGLVFYQRRMMARAKGYFLNALRANPEDLMALERVGDIIMNDEKKPSEALTFFEQIVQKAPTYPDGYWFVASACYDMARYDRCIENLKKCWELDPRGLTQGYHAPILLGKVYMKQKQYELATEAFEASLKINPSNPEVQYLLEQAKNPPKS